VFPIPCHVLTNLRSNADLSHAPDARPCPIYVYGRVEAHYHDVTDYGPYHGFNTMMAYCIEEYGRTGEVMGVLPP